MQLHEALSRGNFGVAFLLMEAGASVVASPPSRKGGPGCPPPLHTATSFVLSRGSLLTPSHPAFPSKKHCATLMYAFGKDDYQLGVTHRERSEQWQPRALTCLPFRGVVITRVAVGRHHTVAVNGSGEAWRCAPFLLRDPCVPACVCVWIGRVSCECAGY